MPKVETCALALAACLSFSRVGRAATELSAPVGGGPSALAVRVDLVAGILRYRTCAALPCAADETSATLPIELDRSSLPDPAQVVVEILPLGEGREVVHVRVPARGASGPMALAWEAVLGAGAPPVFAGPTGWVRGQEGEREGTIVQIVGDATKTIIVGDAREDLRICGQEATALRPRGLDPKTLLLRGATLQRLGSDQRAAAEVIIARAHGGPATPPLAQLLVGVGASTLGAHDRALSDGDPSTTWSEQRPGAGKGEFVLFRAPHEVPIARFALTVAPPLPTAATKPSSGQPAAPRTLYLVTDARTLAVTMPEDAWQHPGQAYEVPLTDPIVTSCIALVLDEAYTHDHPHPEVTVAELYAYSAFDGAGAGILDVARALAGGGGRAEAAAGVLKRAGPAGFLGMANAYASLDAPGRALAIDVAASAESCRTAAPTLILCLVDADEVVREKARAKLEQPECGREAVPALRSALAERSARAAVAPLLASVAPSLSLEPLVGVMGDGPPPVRAAVRTAFAHAAARAAPDVLASLLGDAHRPEGARLELLRATQARLPDLRPAADAAMTDLLHGTPPMRSRYLLVEPLVTLAAVGDTEATSWLGALLAHDAEGAVRAHAAESSGSVPAIHDALILAVRDPEPRVREAALHALATAHVEGARDVAAAALGGDLWTFVRTSAAITLASLRPAVEADRALGEAVKDASPNVRAAAIAGLALHRATAYRSAIRARLDDENEELDVRVSAARALGPLCDARSLDRLTSLAREGAAPGATETDTLLGLAATEAIGAIHPPDSAARLQKVRGKDARPDARRAAERALAQPGMCR